MHFDSRTAFLDENRRGSATRGNISAVASLSKSSLMIVDAGSALQWARRKTKEKSFTWLSSKAMGVGRRRFRDDRRCIFGSYARASRDVLVAQCNTALACVRRLASRLRDDHSPAQEYRSRSGVFVTIGAACAGAAWRNLLTQRLLHVAARCGLAQFGAHVA